MPAKREPFSRSLDLLGDAYELTFQPGHEPDEMRLTVTDTRNGEVVGVLRVTLPKVGNQVHVDLVVNRWAAVGKEAALTLMDQLTDTVLQDFSEEMGRTMSVIRPIR
ncbi:MAG TPA: hypothetical protein VEY30_10440 [Myxococcaceae bacterium]|nr:hypothetical protein [Myxococcaceae bacterium]